MTHSSRDSWKGLGDYQSSTPGPYHLFPHCGWGLSELPADLSVQVLPNPLQSKGVPTIADYFKQRHSQNVYHLNWARSWDFCRSGAAVVTAEGHLFTHLIPTTTAWVSTDCVYSYRLPQLETISGNEGNQAKAKGKAMLLLEVFLKWKSKISQQRCFHRQDG